jgi:hypothetical protein
MGDDDQRVSRGVTVAAAVIAVLIVALALYGVYGVIDSAGGIACDG